LCARMFFTLIQEKLSFSRKLNEPHTTYWKHYKGGDTTWLYSKLWVVLLVSTLDVTKL